MFTDTDDQVIDPYVVVRPEVIAALGKLISGGGSLDARARRRARVGVLRGKAAVPDLVEATHSKDSDADLRIARRATEDPRRIGRPAR